MTDIDYIFPSTQKTLTFSIEGAVTDEWEATLEYTTLIVDQVSYDRAEFPFFDNSTIIGYYESVGSRIENSTGSITIPANMYGGKILPASDRYVPITVVNIKWTNIASTASTYSQNIAYIQQWEPGVIIGDPRDDVLFEPIESIPSTLTLTAPARIVQGDTLVLTATTDIPIDIGDDNPCSFYYLNGTTPVLLGTSLFSNATKTAIFNYNTTGVPFETYEIYAEFGGRREYGRTRSNTIEVEILEGVPLIVTTSSFTPSREIYFPGNVQYSLRVIPDPSFPPSGVLVANPVTIQTIDGFIPFTSSTFFTGNFSNGIATGTFSVLSSMIDTALAHTGTNWTITTSTQNTTTYTATIFVTNTETVRTAWGYQTLGQYAKGSTSTNIQVGTSTIRTVLADPFPIIITQNNTTTLQEESFTVTVVSTSRPYLNNISIIAVDQVSGNTSTIFNANNSGTSIFTATISTLSTGTYTLYATYPGDIGNNIYWANQAAISNTLIHTVRSGNDLGARFVFYSTTDLDILRVWATTSTTLTQTVSFYNSATIIGTSTWSRQLINYNIPSTTIATTATSGNSISFANNFTGDRYFNINPARNRLGYGWTSPNNDNNDDLTILAGQQTYGWSPVSPNVYNKSADLPSPVLNNRYRLFKYYDGTNYNLEETTSTKGANIADPVQFGVDWNIKIRGYEQFNLNQPFINTNTTFYNYIESRFGYAAMVEYLQEISSLDGSPLKLNNIVLNDRPPSSGTFSGPGPVQIVKRALYDVYRVDTIGDSRGYNVIGIDANSGFVRNSVSESNPTRLYFIGANNIERYIDLVEYIGETEWDKPIETEGQKVPTTRFIPGTWPPQFETTTDPRSKVKVFLYRFTPTIPQTNTVFRTGYEQNRIIDLIPNNNWLARPLPTFPNDWLTDEIGGYLGRIDYYRDANFTGAEYTQNLRSVLPQAAADCNFINARIDYKEYGKKVWISANASDPDENDKAAFYNDWYNAFTIPTSNVYTTTTFTTTYITVTSNELQNATLTFAKNTINNPALLTARWPGTRYLDPIFGKFNPFNINCGSPADSVILSAYEIDSNGTRIPTSKVFSTNYINIVANIYTNFVDILPAYGDITLINADTNEELFTQELTNNEAVFNVNANDLTDLTTGLFINFKVRYNNPGFEDMFSNIINLQVIRSLYTDGEFEYINNNTDSKIIYEHISTASIHVNDLRFNGNINFLLPIFLDNSYPIAGQYPTLFLSIRRDFGTWETSRLFSDVQYIFKDSTNNTPYIQTRVANNNYFTPADVRITGVRVIGNLTAWNGSNINFQSPGLAVANGSKAFYQISITDNLP